MNGHHFGLLYCSEQTHRFLFFVFFCFFPPLWKTGQCQIWPSPNSNTEGWCNVGRESPVNKPLKTPPGCFRKVSVVPGARHFRTLLGPLFCSRYGQSGKSGCSQIYSVSCSHGNKWLGFLLQTYHKAHPLSLTPCRGAYKDLKNGKGWRKRMALLGNF